MDIGNPKIKIIIGPLEYDDFYTQIIKYNTFDKIPKNLQLNIKRFDDAISTKKIALIIAVCTIFGFFFVDYSEYKITILFFGGFLTYFFISISQDRKSLQFEIELTETELIVGAFRYFWIDIDSIYKICTYKDGHHKQFGVKLILKDLTEININLALRKPEIGNTDDTYHFIYMFWRRANSEK